MGLAETRNIPYTALEWIVGKSTGTSSITIWGVMAGIKSADFRGDTPRDPSDFERCLGLLKAVPEWADHLDEIPKVFPWWKPMIDNWTELVDLWKAESPSGRCPLLFQRMRELNEDARKMQEYTTVCEGYWEIK